MFRLCCMYVKDLLLNAAIGLDCERPNFLWLLSPFVLLQVPSVYSTFILPQILHFVFLQASFEKYFVLDEHHHNTSIFVFLQVFSFLVTTCASPSLKKKDIIVCCRCSVLAHCQVYETSIAKRIR